MKKCVQITPGMRSGKLTVLGPTKQSDRGRRMWECQCECGNRVLLEGYKIAGGRVGSCGCARKGHGLQNIAGERFGHLVARERLTEKRGSSYLWSCQCDCGKTTVATVSQLRRGQITSCGCAKTAALQRRSKDISGRIFGRLTAIEPLQTRRQGSVIWRCRCQCGAECEVAYNSLVSGNTRSCGCMRHKHMPPPLHYVDGTCVEMLERRNLQANNTSGHTGIQETGNKRWRASIVFKGRRYHLGTYVRIEDAVLVRERAEKELFGRFLEEYYAGQTETADQAYPAEYIEGQTVISAEDVNSVPKEELY